jgi:hypothetical protein
MQYFELISGPKIIYDFVLRVNNEELFLFGECMVHLISILDNESLKLKNIVEYSFHSLIFCLYWSLFSLFEEDWLLHVVECLINFCAEIFIPWYKFRVFLT